MNAYVDAHAHLGDPVFDPDRDAVLERARSAGVIAILCVGETLADAERILIAEHLDRAKTKTEAARTLGIGLRTLYTKIQQLHLDGPQPRAGSVRS